MKIEEMLKRNIEIPIKIIDNRIGKSRLALELMRKLEELENK